MQSTTLLSVSLLALIGQIVPAASVKVGDGTTRQCFYYSGADTNSATCNEIPDLICTEGCRDNFVAAEGCRPSDGSAESAAAPLTSQNCTIGFGRDTAASKTCLTESNRYSCSGKTTGFTNCYGCVRTRTVYHVPAPDNLPPSSYNQSLSNPTPGSGNW